MWQLDGQSLTFVSQSGPMTSLAMLPSSITHTWTCICPTRTFHTSTLFRNTLSGLSLHLHMPPHQSYSRGCKSICKPQLTQTNTWLTFKYAGVQCHAPGIFHFPLYLLSTSSRLTQDIRQETRDVMHPAFFTFLLPSFYFFKTHSRHPTREDKTTFVIVKHAKRYKGYKQDYWTTRRCSHPNPTRRYRQNPWAHRPSSPERRDDEGLRLANTLGRQREPGLWDGTRSPMAQQRA